jgi:hypothetical protein
MALQSAKSNLFNYKVLRSVLNSVQRTNYSTHTLRQRTAVIIFDNGEEQRRNTLLGPNKQFPFPGDVAPSVSYKAEAGLEQAVPAEDEPPKREPETAYKTTSVSQLLHRALVTRAVEYEPTPVESHPEERDDEIELSASECPALLRMELEDLFTDMDLRNRNVQMLNLTLNASTWPKWSDALELEKMQIVAMLIDAANVLCSMLKQAGYWADFIDPRSGRPYFGKSTDEQFFDTDDRYRHLGFNVERASLCKVIQNIAWEDKFVCTLFTDAPRPTEALQDEVLKQLKLSIVDQSSPSSSSAV